MPALREVPVEGSLRALRVLFSESSDLRGNRVMRAIFWRVYHTAVLVDISSREQSSISNPFVDTCTL